ncbi:DNA damage response protein RcaA [Talaromyces islandicus]|uniref:DNA damage response protein RcaA n=1 Tax=Talaromyces islandicus TaxID=28573 RepID=A0A0U1LKG2_TALIS|nr:DNA damage response protein RcaA [Talaromyces islandicus]
MWILESDGDLLGGKRVWLKPGKKYLFGRIKQAGIRHVIQDISISRKHLVVEVSPMQPGDGAHVHKKSLLTVTDQNSKCGTTIDGVQIRGSSKVLTEDEHTLQLGRYQPALRIKWQPTVLSFSFSSKELKAKDPLGPARSRLEELDIKTIIPYVEKTTHVIQNKRNTAKGLQALINGKYIVQDSFIDALVYAATPGDLETAESLSPLETDFDANWPDAGPYLPPAGKEPVQRPAESFAPNPSRAHVFEGFTFVFCDAGQFDNLSPPINNGHGKALFYQVENGLTTANELLQFMRNAAGEQDPQSTPSGDGGVVLVRFRAKRYEDWSIQLGNDVALMMDQRVIEQSEFLDAILSNDATSLCRTLPRDDFVEEPQPRKDSRQCAPVQEAFSNIDVTPTQVEEITQPEPSQAETQTEAKRAKRSQSRPFVSRVKKFDDGFDMEDIPMHHEPGDADIDVPPHETVHQTEPQKPPEQPAEEDDGMSGLLPGANAMKRRRAEMGPRSFHDAVQVEDAPKPKRQKIDVLAAARRRLEEQEEAAALQRKQEDDLNAQTTVDGMALEEMKNLVIVEEFQVPLRQREDTTVEETDRWDERWNGRKNFKKFRKRGEPSVARSHIQAVIVPLDEVKRKDYGIGDHYWTNNNEREESPDPIFRRTSQQQQPQSRQQRIGQSISRAESQVSLAVSEEAPASLSAPSARSETPRLSASTAQKSQRASQKRTRETRLTVAGEDDSDEEELRFKFRRRR